MSVASMTTLLRFLLSPEDTSPPVPDIRDRQVAPALKGIKTTLWIAFSILAAVLVGRL
jgi:hypothetical protein